MTVGIDLAKETFAVHGVYQRGKAKLRKQIVESRDDDSAIAKSFLSQIVDEILLDGQTLRVKGNHVGLAEAMQTVKVDTKSVPTFNLNWRARHDECGHWELYISTF